MQTGMCMCDWSEDEVFVVGIFASVAYDLLDSFMIGAGINCQDNGIIVF